jgi:hypothetical protein
MHPVLHHSKNFHRNEQQPVSHGIQTRVKPQKTLPRTMFTPLHEITPDSPSTVQGNIVIGHTTIMK